MIQSILLSLCSLSVMNSSISNIIGYENNAPFYPTTHYTSNTYFENLYEHGAVNLGNTCSFVALSSILSYADTFYNDDYIPERFEETTSCETYEESCLVSPGFISNSKLQEESISAYVARSYSYDFQSFLIHNFNFIINYGNLIFDDPLDYSSSTFPSEFDSLLSALYPVEMLPEIVSYRVGNLDFQKTFIKNEIDKGNVVIASIYNKTETGFNNGHAVVAYKYDTDNIYANYGWGENYTEYPLLNDNYNWIGEAVSFDFSNVKKGYSDNYKFGGKGYSGSNISGDVIWVSGGYNNDTPTFRWMRKYNTVNNNEWFDIKIGVFNNNMKVEVSSFDTSYNELTLSFTLWQYLLAHTTEGIYFEVVRHLDGVDFMPYVTEFR